ncbi:MAG TPA: cytochrome c3 family protein, partial [Candidatus Binatia bacterium]|nr:cytochrome c3 family protein [Candidatus Binatia bacterium]
SLPRDGGDERGGHSTIFCAFFVVLTLATGIAMAQPQEESCAVCHGALGVEHLTKPVELYKADIHAAKGFGCVACHGGDATIMSLESMDPKKGYIGKPTPVQVVEICGRCHSDARFMRQYNPSLRVDQVTEYNTSVHGRRLKELKDSKVATCASCHTPHSIRPPSDTRSSVYPLRVADTCGSCHANAEYMAPYKIPTDQVEKYKKSVHWKLMTGKGDLSAPTCNDCHGNHGAAPPGISWVGNVCGQCHPVNTELFNKSRHGQLFVQMGIPGCATCHSNHEILETSDAMLGVGDQAICASCHTQQDTGGKTALAMRETIERLRGEYEAAHATLANAENAGMEVSQPLFELNGAKTALVKARAAIHGFNLDGVKAEVQTGLEIAEKARAQGIKVLDELQFRRKGLAVSVLIILALVVGLVLKIRQMERKP